MRKNEITDELIALSKQAKSLGFPQDIDLTDWFLNPSGKVCLCLCVMTKVNEIGDELEIYTPEMCTLILTFDICLDWLNGQGISTILENDRIRNSCMCSVFMKMGNIISLDAPTRHEAIAKVVVQRLEDDNDKTTE